MVVMRNAKRILVGNPEGKTPLGGSSLKLKDNIKMYPKGINLRM
jgi:hypothetical protein